MTTNEISESSRFSGSIPRHYDDYLGPLFFEPYALEVANRVDPSRVKLAIELASGTGRVTRHLKKRLSPSAKLIASDISDDMLAIAKEKLKDESIEWMSIDAQELPFENNSVDLIVCCFGYMFVPDKVKAFSEALRILRPGGMLLFTTWDKLESNGASFVYRTIAKKYLEEPLPETYNLPFSMHDERAINDSLEKAGFKKITIEKLEKQSTSPSAQFAAEGISQGGLIYNEIMKRNPGWMTEIKVSLEKQLAEKFGEAPMTAPMKALIVRAWK
jgi:ubiquinone/menaquinone biosynthesis C-methylase UbiE